jgi:CRISPR/Cas system CMR subunit Cmr4 (Cas7 group RAMP superfamily)
MASGLLATILTYSSVAAMVTALITTGIYKNKIDTSVNNVIEIKNDIRSIVDTTKKISDKIIVIEISQKNMYDKFDVFFAESKDDRADLRKNQSEIKIDLNKNQRDIKDDLKNWQNNNDCKIIKYETTINKNNEALEDLKKILQLHILTKAY